MRVLRKRQCFSVIYSVFVNLTRKHFYRNNAFNLLFFNEIDIAGKKNIVNKREAEVGTTFRGLSISTVMLPNRHNLFYYTEFLN